MCVCACVRVFGVFPEHCLPHSTYCNLQTVCVHVCGGVGGWGEVCLPLFTNILTNHFRIMWVFCDFSRYPKMLKIDRLLIESDDVYVCKCMYIICTHNNNYMYIEQLNG